MDMHRALRGRALQIFSLLRNETILAGEAETGVRAPSARAGLNMRHRGARPSSIGPARRVGLRTSGAFLYPVSCRMRLTWARFGQESACSETDGCPPARAGDRGMAPGLIT
jgi:hypothetical protein